MTSSVNSFFYLASFFMLQMPNLSAMFPFIERSNINAISIFFGFFLILFSFKINPRNLAFFLVSVIILLLPFVYSILDGNFFISITSFMRYGLYLLIFHHLLTANRSLVKDISKIYLGFFVLSVFFGIITSNYMIVNGIDRFAGASHSPASFAVQSFTAFVLLFSYRFLNFSFDEPKRYKFFVGLALVALLFLVYMSGSRQPLLGIFLIGGLYLFRLNIKFFVLLTIFISLIFLFFIDVTDLKFIRMQLLLSSLLDGSLFSDVGTIKDGSLRARVDFIVFTYEKIFLESNFFGMGLNSFTSQWSSDRKIAAHFDIIQLLFDFGIPVTIAYITLIIVSVWKLLKMRLSWPYIVLFYFVGLSFNNPLYYHASFSLIIIMLTYFYRSRTTI
jgi:hypothetical protein